MVKVAPGLNSFSSHQKMGQIFVTPESVVADAATGVAEDWLMMMTIVGIDDVDDDGIAWPVLRKRWEIWRMWESHF